MKIYVASSWRNTHQPEVVARLRAEGHEVYDFRNPHLGTLGHGFSWSEVDPNWQRWTAEQYKTALEHPIAEAGLDADLAGLKWANTIVAVQPFGRSTALELGWGCGAGKDTAILLAEGQEPELMQGLAGALCLTIEELLDYLEEEEEPEEETSLCDECGARGGECTGGCVP